MNTPTRTIVLATANPGKVREIRMVLADLPVTVLALGDLPPVAAPAEDGATFAANARTKADLYARATGHWCLADDSGLVVDALGGEPGVRSARYATDQCPASAPRKVLDAANNRKLLDELADVPDRKRTARFVCHLVLSDGRQALLESCDTLDGRIARGASGANGFGYDPVFLIPGLGKTLAQLTAEQKNAISHRGKAVRHFSGLLADLLAGERQAESPAVEG